MDFLSKGLEQIFNHPDEKLRRTLEHQVCVESMIIHAFYS